MPFKVVVVIIFAWLLPLQTFAQDLWFVQDLKVESLRVPQNTKKGVIAIIGTGIQCDHPDLRGAVNVYRSKSYVSSSACESNGHETAVANIVNAVSNGTADLVSLKVFDGPGPRYSTPPEVIRKAFEEVASWPDDFVVINASFDQPRDDGLLPILRRLGKKALIIASAGNDGSTNVNSPCFFGNELSNVICVGAIDQGGRLWVQSNWGPKVEIAAFGVGLYGPLGTGTSFAAPIVSALAHLTRNAMLARGFKPTPALLKKILVEGGKPNQNLKGMIGDPSQAFGWQASGENLMALVGRVMTPWSADIKTFSDSRAGDVIGAQVIGSPITLRQLEVKMFFRSENGDVLTIVPNFVDKDTITFTAPNAGRYWLSLNIEGMISTNESPITVHPARQPHVQPDSLGSSQALPIASGQELRLLIPGFQPSYAVEAWVGSGNEDWQKLVYVASFWSTEVGFFEAKFQLPAISSSRGRIASLVLRVDGQFVPTPVEIFLKARRGRP